MLEKIPERLKSRKLWSFIGVTILVLLNFVFKLNMPADDVLYLVILGASYILGQGYVDAKRQPVKDFPVDDVNRSVTNIIQAELSKLDFSKNVPMEKIIEELTPIMKQVLGGLTFTLAAPEASVSNQDPASSSAVNQEQQTA